MKQILQVCTVLCAALLPSLAHSGDKSNSDVVIQILNRMRPAMYDGKMLGAISDIQACYEKADSIYQNRLCVIYDIAIYNTYDIIWFVLTRHVPNTPPKNVFETKKALYSRLSKYKDALGMKSPEDIMSAYSDYTAAISEVAERIMKED